MESCNPYQDIPFFEESVVSNNLNMMNIIHGFKLSYEAFYYIINGIAHPSSDLAVIPKNIFPWNSKLYHNVFSGKYSNQDSFLEDVSKILDEIKSTCLINRDICRNAFTELKRLICTKYDKTRSIFNTPEVLITFEFDALNYTNLNLFLTQLHRSPPAVIKSLYYNWSIFHPDISYPDEFVDFSTCKEIERYEQSFRSNSYDISDSKYKSLIDTSSYLKKNLKSYDVYEYGGDEEDKEDKDEDKVDHIDLSHLQLSPERSFIPINSKKLQSLYPEDHLLKEFIAFMTLKTFHLLDNHNGIKISDVVDNNNKINNLSSLSSKSNKNMFNNNNNNNKGIKNGNNGLNNSLDNKNDIQILYYILCKCYKCNCNYYAPSLPYLFKHLNEKHKMAEEEVQVIQTLVCPIDKCNYVFDNKYKFLDHIMQHNFYSHFENLKYLDNSSLIYECVYPECGFNTKNEMSYTAHILSHTKQVKKKNGTTTTPTV